MEEKQLIEQYKIQGKQNAINYVKEKYGLDVKVLKVLVDKNSPALFVDLSPKPNGNVLVNMKANEKEFYVYITAKEKSTDGEDNYQFDEITDDVVDLISSLVPQKAYKYEIDATHSVYNLMGMLDKNEYYDGTNLKEMVRAVGLDLFIHYIGNVDFGTIDFDSTNGVANNMTLMLISYDSKSDYKKSIELTSEMQLFSLENYVRHGEGYIKSAVGFFRGEKYYYER